MDVVRNFNNELSSVCEARPPISRAKMAAITKSAIKGIKFYKHIVQSVEKFIHKGRPEFKVPGLYVMDSIVRQSRHQFSSEKDVFGPRFSKNIVRTFQFLFQCKGDDRSKVIRVLNLWQKNSVFPPAVIQPLLDLATDPTSTEVFDKVQKAVQSATGLAPSVPVPVQKAAEPVAPDTNNTAAPKGSVKPAVAPPAAAPGDPAAAPAVQNEVLDAVAQLLQQSQKPQQSLSLSAQQQQLQQLQLLQQQLMQQTQVNEPKPVAQTPPILDTALLGQIQTLTNQLMQTSKEDTKPDKAAFKKELLDFDYGESEDEDDKKQHPSPKTNNSGIPGNVQSLLNDPSIMKHLHQMSETIQKTEQLKNELSMQEVRQKMLEQQQHQDDDYSQDAEMEEGEVEPDHHERRSEGRRRRRRSKDRSRSHSRDRRKRRKSRSRSRERKRSRSREWRSKSRDEGSENRNEKRRKEKERKALGFPTHVKEKHMTVCSTTIWIGHLSKNTTQDNIMDEMVNYGEVHSVNLVPPRGCAYVCLSSRKDASRALSKLKGVKLLGNTLKVAWATNKGILESKWKHLWDVDQGSTFIPWDDLPDNISLDELTEGGVIDPETIPKRLRNKEESNADAVAPMPTAHPLAPVPPNAMPVMPPPIPAGLPPMMMPPMMMPGMPPMMPPMSMPPPLPPNLMAPTGPPPVSLPMQIEKAPENPPLPPEANEKPSHLMQTLKNLMNQYGSGSKPPPSFSVPPPGFDPSQPPPPIMANTKPPLPTVNASPNEALPTRKEVLQSPEQVAPVKAKNSINIVLGSLKTSSIQQLIQEAEHKPDGLRGSSPPPSGSDIEMSMSDQEGDGQIIEYQAPPPPQTMVMPDMSMPPPNMMNMSSPMKECPPFPPPPISQTKFSRFSDANSSTNGASDEFNREGTARGFNRPQFPSRQNEDGFPGFEPRGNNSESTFGALERNNSEGESGFGGRGSSIRPLMSVQNPRYNQPSAASGELRKKPDAPSFGKDYDRDRQKDSGNFGRRRDEYSPRGSRSRDRGHRDDHSRGDWNRESRYQDGYRGNERHSRFGSRWNDEDRSRGGGRRGEYDRHLPFSTDKHERMLSPRYNQVQETPPTASSHQPKEAPPSEASSVQHSQDNNAQEQGVPEREERLSVPPPDGVHESEQSEPKPTESAADEAEPIPQVESYPAEEAEPALEPVMAEPQEQFELEPEAPEPPHMVEDPQPAGDATEAGEVDFEPAEAAYEPAETAPEPLSSTTEAVSRSEHIAEETADAESS